MQIGCNQCVTRVLLLACSGSQRVTDARRLLPNDPKLHSVYNRITRGSHPGCARVRPNYVRACTCPCPAMSTQSTRVAPSRPRRIRCTVGLRLHAGSAPTSCQGRSQVTRGWNAGYALVTPWSRPGNQTTLQQHPVHHGAKPGLRDNQAQVTPGVHQATPW